MHLLKCGSPFNQAFILYQHAMKLSWRFVHQLYTKLNVFGFKVEGNIKTNLRRIALKIMDLNAERRDNRGIFCLTDMIRATITVQQKEQLR